MNELNITLIENYQIWRCVIRKLYKGFCLPSHNFAIIISHLLFFVNTVSCTYSISIKNASLIN